MYNSELWKSEFILCPYSARLINKLSKINKEEQDRIDLDLVKKAIYYARKYHNLQKRQSGEPYYSHPLEVAYMISDYLFRTDVIVTSILHDVLEDTELTFEKISFEFGEHIATQVLDLTRIKPDGIKITSAEIVESLWIQKKYDILLIKQFDRLHNLQTINAKSPDKIRKIIKETITSFAVLAAYLGIRSIEEEIIKTCLNYTKDPEDNPISYHKLDSH